MFSRAFRPLLFGGGIVTGLTASALFYSSSPSFSSSSSSSSSSKPMAAICVLQPDNNSSVNGTVKFSQEPGKQTKISGVVKGLTDGCHGFHVHELGNLSQGCMSAKGHFNPFNVNHGGPRDEVRHVGDLGNIHSEGGVAIIDKTDPLIELSGEYSIIGRSLIVHADKDDFGRGGNPDSLITGHAGARVACGVIGLDA